ncbi:MAG TPA: N-acetyltransferase, partial [Bacillota bacterium]|nr:N-acetyltransferase [Bacillota bacterium]
ELKGTLVFDIGPLAVLPGYQGKGLGRALLRAILAYAGERRTDAVLSVDSTNESALRLYSEEGFKKVKGFACYVLAL